MWFRWFRATPSFQGVLEDLQGIWSKNCQMNLVGMVDTEGCVSVPAADQAPRYERARSSDTAERAKPVAAAGQGPNKTKSGRYVETS